MHSTRQGPDADVREPRTGRVAQRLAQPLLPSGPGGVEGAHRRAEPGIHARTHRGAGTILLGGFGGPGASSRYDPRSSTKRDRGEVREWLNRPASKAVVVERLPWVRIPPSPPALWAEGPGGLCGEGQFGGSLRSPSNPTHGPAFRCVGLGGLCGEGGIRSFDLPRLGATMLPTRRSEGTQAVGE
jgi:hypothetical protein